MRGYRFLLAALFVSVLTLNAAKNEEKAVEEPVVTELPKEVQLQNTQDELSKIQKELSRGNSVWLKSYNSYMAYQESRKSLREVQHRINQLEDRSPTVERKLEIEALQAKQKVLTDQIELLKAQGASPFVSLLKPDEAGELPNITNPFEIVTGLSYVKRINSQYKDYVLREEELQEIIGLLERQVALYKDMMRLNPKEDYEVELDATLLQVEKFKLALDTLISTADLYQKRIESTEAKINKEIKDQLYKLLNIGVIIVVLFGISLLLKRIAKRYITDNERFYTANKIVTFINVSLIILIILFSYIDNVGYLATVLGFASAGLAIAMRDWFMSALGWLVIIMGGSIHVGDRVRFEKDGMIYVGDVLDISLQRITLMEDVTITTLETNRRAGRIIFVPNNYIFTSMIANYTHGALKTVWDGIDIIITFDSNHKKAAHLVKEICRKYSKGYTDITRKQLNKLRDKYSLKNSNVEPRVFTLIAPHGIKVSAWYLTNAYATLTLRSTISADIVDAFNAEPDITIAYPTQTFYTGPIPPKAPMPSMEDQ
ncbi:MscS Mechanosensitive ion channel [Sulfuricurvum kujiense DSM 16994]|uniref:MscS Mechanosensitive ion channel n=1 Tax=Sulfuricurvum kujiense (strain ATCC BAA-921 / DSM 16994 / JCM 11577 / YK-1) TaxID=709032 RepID=E4U304_SULKY|nr:mechanosensitive ion channel domain-containing protein [Sulfuricurvum kujiense]ADR33674.1 MscS Mechanosensitive ion channel [Sulfuricurvum kujiense DSM 16994]